LVPLDEQDRGAWDTALIAEGHRLVRERLAAAAAGVAPGRYQILAAINAVHTSARDMRDTDWSQVVALYDPLVRLDPSPLLPRRAAPPPPQPPPTPRARRPPSPPPRGGRGPPPPAWAPRWPAPPPTTRPGRICCAGWAAAGRRGPPTTGRSSWRATPPRPAIC